MHFARCAPLVCVLLLGAGPAKKDAVADPLRLVPKEADVVVQVPEARKLLEHFTKLPVGEKLYKIDAIREAYDSTNYRRLVQLVAYFEKKLGERWPALLDDLAAGGLVLASRYYQEQPPFLVVLQGKDADRQKKFYQLTVEVIEQELERQEKGKLKRDAHRDIETIHAGDDLHAALAGSAVILTNKKESLHRALDLHKDGDDKSVARIASVKESRADLPKNCLAWVWVNLEPMHATKEAQEVFASPRSDPNQTIILGGVLDVIGRSKHVYAGLYEEDGALVTSIRLPAGRNGSKDMGVQIPPADDVGLLPILEPKQALYSTSFYYDFGKLWTERGKLFNEEVVKGFEEFDKGSGTYLLGTRFSQLLANFGSHHRFVVAQTKETGYERKPEQRFPAFALISEAKDKKLCKQLEGIFRGAALLARTQVKIKLVEEKVGDINLIGYRFDETEKFRGDRTGIRFNYSPCFAVVGDQFISCSTMELGRELIEMLQKEAKDGVKRIKGKNELSRLYAAGGADLLAEFEDRLIAGTILNQALKPDTAKEQVRLFLDVIRSLGVFDLTSVYGDKDFRYETKWKVKKE